MMLFSSPIFYLIYSITMTNQPNRQWQRNHFEDHPGLSTKDPQAKHSGKTKVICKKCLEHFIEEMQRQDREANLEERPRNLLISLGMAKLCELFSDLNSKLESFFYRSFTGTSCTSVDTRAA